MRFFDTFLLSVAALFLTSCHHSRIVTESATASTATVSTHNVQGTTVTTQTIIPGIVLPSLDGPVLQPDTNARGWLIQTRTETHQRDTTTSCTNDTTNHTKTNELLKQNSNKVRLDIVFLSAVIFIALFISIVVRRRF